MEDPAPLINRKKNEGGKGYRKGQTRGPKNKKGIRLARHHRRYIITHDMERDKQKWALSKEGTNPMNHVCLNTDISVKTTTTIK